MAPQHLLRGTAVLRVHGLSARSVHAAHCPHRQRAGAGARRVRGPLKRAHPHRLLAAAAHGALHAKRAHAVHHVAREAEGHLARACCVCWLGACVCMRVGGLHPAPAAAAHNMGRISTVPSKGPASWPPLLCQRPPHHLWRVEEHALLKGHPQVDLQHRRARAVQQHVAQVAVACGGGGWKRMQGARMMRHRLATRCCQARCGAHGASSIHSGERPGACARAGDGGGARARTQPDDVSRHGGHRDGAREARARLKPRRGRPGAGFRGERCEIRPLAARAWRRPRMAGKHPHLQRGAHPPHPTHTHLKASRKKLWKTGGKRERHSPKAPSSCSGPALDMRW